MGFFFTNTLLCLLFQQQLNDYLAKRFISNEIGCTEAVDNYLAVATRTDLVKRTGGGKRRGSRSAGHAAAGEIVPTGEIFLPDQANRASVGPMDQTPTLPDKLVQ